MADGTVVGRVKVKVYPDTRDFRRDLKNQLDRIEKGLSLEVDATLNSKMLQRHADAVVKRMNRENRKIVFGAELKAEGVERAARDASRKVDRALKDKHINFLAKLDDGSRDRVERELRDVYEKYDQKSIEFQVAVDSILASAELARVSRDRIVTLHVNVSKGSLAKAEATLAALSGLRLLHSTLDNLWSAFKNLDKNIPLIGGITEAVMGLSAWLLAAASNTFALARSLAQIGSLALLLPGMVGGFAIGIGSAIAVLKDFNTVLPEVGDRLGEIQDKMSTAFYSAAAEPIRKLVDHLFPQLERGLHTTSALLGQWFGGLADSLTTSLDGSLDQMFGDLAVSIGIASTANDDLATSIRILGKYGSMYLPRLAQWYADAAESFADWLTTNEQNGQLTEWIELGITNLKDLGRVAGETGGILAGLARAANEAGGSSLGMMADTLERVHRTVDSANFQQNLIEVLESAHDAMNRISTQSGPAVKAFFDDFSSILAGGFRTAGDAIGDLLDGIFRGLNTDGFKTGFLAFLDGLRAGIASLDGAWEPIGEAIGAIGRLAGVMARNFGPLLAQVLGSISEMISTLAPKLVPVIENLTSMVSGALDGLIPIIEGIVNVLGSIVGAVGSSPAAIAGLATAFVALKVALSGTAIAQGLAGLLSFAGKSSNVSKMATAIGSLAGKAGAIGLVVAALGGLAGAAGSIDLATTSVSEFDVALRGLSTGGSFESINKLFEAKPSLGGTIFNHLLKIPYKETAASIQSLGDASRTLSEDANTNWVEKMFGVGPRHQLTLHTSALNTSKKMMNEFDTAMAGIVSSGNPEQIAQAQRFLRFEAERTGTSVAALTKHMPEFALAQKDAAIQAEFAAQEQARATALTQQAVDQYIATMSQTKGLAPALAGEINDVSKTFIDFSAGLEENTPSVDQWVTGLEKQVQAMTDWADNLATLKSRGASDAVISELTAMEQEGAGIVQSLVDKADYDFGRLNGIAAAKVGGAASTSTAAFQRLSAEGQTALASLPPAVRTQLQNAGVIVADEAGNWGIQVEQGLANATPGVSGAAKGLTDSVATQFNANKERLGVSGTEAGQAYTKGVGQADVSGAANGILTSLDGILGGAAKIKAAIQGKGVATSVADGVTSGKPQVTAAAKGLNSAATTGFQNVAPKFREAGTKAGGGFGQGIQSGVPKAQAASRSLTTGAVSAASNVAGQMRAKGAQAGQGLAAGIRSQSGAVAGAIRSLTVSVTLAAAAMGIALRARGILAAQGLATGLRGGAGAVIGAARALATGVNSALMLLPIMMLARGILAGGSLASGLRGASGAVASAAASLASAAEANAHADLYSAGVNAGSGFANGIRSQVGAAAAAAASIAAAASSAARKNLDIHSPSRVFYKIGEFTVKGFTKAVKKKRKTVTKTVSRVFGPGMFKNGKKISTESRKSLGKVSKDIEKMLDFNHKDRLSKKIDKSAKKVEKRTRTLVKRVDKAVNRTHHDALDRVNIDTRRARQQARRAMDVSPERFANGAGRGTQINFNAPVGADPYEIARSIDKRANDALAMEGLAL